MWIAGFLVSCFVLAVLLSIYFDEEPRLLIPLFLALVTFGQFGATALAPRETVKINEYSIVSTADRFSECRNDATPWCKNFVVGLKQGSSASFLVSAVDSQTGVVLDRYIPVSSEILSSGSQEAHVEVWQERLASSWLQKVSFVDGVAQITIVKLFILHGTIFRPL